MAIGTLTMILTNVGLSIFNNWAGSRQNKQIAEKREEFERAVREGQRERMLQLMREGQELTLQMEEEKHQERLQELNDQFDNLIKELAYSAAIEHWPLKTLPIVMKNQALGNLLAKQEEKVALHCILTPSNCYDFNQYVLPKVESALETYCNVHWSALTGSPVLFYSGAWKSNDVPTGTQVDSMRAALSNLPTLLITPFFRPQDHKLVFQAHVWGVGYNNSDQFTIPVIEPTEFQRDYTDELGWLAEDGLIEEAVEDLVPYLQCLIGYIADTYFWSAFGSVPQFPRMLTDGTINTDGMKYLVDDINKNYEDLYAKSEKTLVIQPFAQNNLLSFLSGASFLWSNAVTANHIERIFVSYFSLTKGCNFFDINDVITYDSFNLSDYPFIKQFYSVYERYGNNNAIRQIRNLTTILESIDGDYSLLNSTDVKFLEQESATSDIARYRLGEIYEFSIGVKHNKEKSDCYYSAIKGDNNILINILKSYYFSGIINNEIRMQNIEVPTDKILKYFAKSGIIQASLLLAQIHCSETHTNYIESVQILESIKAEHPYKYYLLSKIPVYDDFENMLRKSADLGYVIAQEKLCTLYKKGDSQIRENPKLHAHYAELGMLQNSIDCTYDMALCYFNGYGVEKSYKTGILLIEKAAQNGHSKAKMFLESINNL